MPDELVTDRRLELEQEVARLRAHVADLQRRMARYSNEDEFRQKSGLDVSISEREELLLAAERIVHMGSWVWDIETDSVSWSDELYRILDCDPETEPASSERFFQAIHPDDRERMQAGSRELVETGVAPTAQFRLLRRDGTIRHAQANGAALFDKDGKLRRVVGTIIDDTERHEAAVKLAQAQERLARAERLELIGRLAGGIAHELNNIMTVIHGGAELLATGEPADFEVLGQLKAAVKSARDLTTRLLAFGRRANLRAHLVDPNEIVRETVRLVKRILGDRIDLVLDLDDATPSATLDSHLTSQALINLLINARDAMPDGGSITIATRGVAGAGGSRVELCVRDSGPGIADSIRDKVFEPFFTTKEGHGSGLGLAMVQGAVEQQGGRVTLSSGPTGSAFTLSFPAFDGPADVASAPPAEATPPLSRYRILVVEDQESLASMVQRLLARAGHEVWVCTSGSEALEFYQHHHGELDLILSDVMMPGMSGVEMVTRMKERGSPPPVLFMSGYGASAARALGAGHTILPKPFTLAELLDAIERTLGP